jgi:rod shape-determining protein MreB and related proteins
MFETRLYVQISDQRLRVPSPQLSEVFECTPCVAIQDVNGKKAIAAIGREAEALSGKPGTVVVNPFGHPRMVLGDFTVGEKLLQHAFRAFLKSRWLSPIVTGVIHPERQLEGGLTQIEYRAIREACENAGCHKVAIHEGRALTMDEVKKYEMPG